MPRARGNATQNSACGNSLNNRIHNVLTQLRCSNKVPNPERPVQLTNGNRPVGRCLYTGDTHKVHGPTHPKFAELGRVYFARNGRTYFPAHQQDIPLQYLEGSHQLLELLAERTIQKGWVQPEPEVEEASDEEAQAPNATDLADSNDEFETVGHVFSNATTATQVDEDIEIISYRTAFDVNVWVWVKNDAPVQRFMVTAKPQNDYQLTLYSMKRELGELDLPVENGAKVEHYFRESDDYLAAFMNIILQLTVWFLFHKWDADLNLDCQCGNGKQTVQCQDCQDFDVCCSEIWIKRHQYNPWHWARVWNGRFFVRSDISVLQEGGFAVQIGHHSCPCPTLDRSKPVKFTVVHSNGVHGTLLSFCNCTSASKVQQLMKSRLFPASALEPETAYTFPMMREFDIHSLQAKTPAYDYVHALRWLMDNAHTHLVNDPYKSIGLAVRVWRFIHDKLRFGEFYGLIPQTMPHLLPGTFVVRCPSCSDPDMNMEDGWWKTPCWLRHLNMMYTTLDGNSKTRRFAKGKGDEVFLYGGKAQFPPSDEYAAFLKRAKEKNIAEPTPDCDSVKVVSRLTDLATHSMAVTGTVNHQCSHIFIMGVTDMYASENQANVDAAFSRGYSLYGYEDKKIEDSTTHRKEVPHKQTYDAECAYAVNQNIRFKKFKYLKGQRDFVPRLKRGIPVVHLVGHILAICRMLFALFYHWCNGHFMGETAEQAWPELNKAGTYTCQMKTGHRLDVLIAAYNNWNQKKIVNLAYIIARELAIAALQMEDHMYLFQQSSWNLVPRLNPEVKDSWIDTYHQPEKGQVPTVESILRSIAQQDGGGISLAIPLVGVDLDVSWCRAFEAEDIRERIAILEEKIYLPPVEVKALEGFRERLEQVLVDFRERQNVITPRLPSRFSEGKIEGVEGFTLGLPSDMTTEERLAYGTAQLAIQEGSLHRSHAHDTINMLQSTSRKIETLVLYKDQNVSMEKMRTRFGKSFQGVLDMRARLLAVYNHNRQMLVNLKEINEDDQDLPPLSPKDTERKDHNRKRRTGDSKHCEGVLWTIGPSSLKKLPATALGVGDEAEMEELYTSTRMTQRLGKSLQPAMFAILMLQMTARSSRSVWDGLTQVAKKSRKKNKDPAAPAIPQDTKEAREAKHDKQFRKERDEGLLWSLGARRGMDSSDEAAIEAYEEEAEVYRWIEEFEKKHAEFHRMIRYFRNMEKRWLTMAEDPEDPTNKVEKIDDDPDTKAAKVHTLRARAYRQAGIWGDYARVALAQFKEVSYPAFFDMDTPLAPRVAEFRDQQFAWAKTLDIEHTDIMFGGMEAGMERSKPSDWKEAKGKGKGKGTGTGKGKGNEKE
ncbi:hypothetical protein V5O48_017109 [Marasmius crinis-equi]|uniref:CxC2-like cysteine cluster KDZ transposase-associated domain-containing protein n=1 Tax=Marasmius crinis-equi TaxID=585013 RepID=A0ABR3EPV6_9AGAR